MMINPQRAGTQGPRWLVLASALLLAGGPLACAQEAPKVEEKSKFDKYRQGTEPSGDPASKELFEKFARYYVARLSDPSTPKDSVNDLVHDFTRRLLVPPTHLYPRLSAEQKKFVDEYGKVLIEALKEPVLKNSKAIVRVNAARMVAEVCRSGYDGAAELCVNILKSPDEVDAVREATRQYAIKGLHSLFDIVPEPTVPEKTIFQKKNDGQIPLLERQSIKAIIDYITRQPVNNPNIAPEALQYIRRDAIRALSRARVQAVKNAAVVESRPALALLRAAQGDGMTPPPTAYERALAVIGFCQLVPDRDRDLQLDYAAYHIGQALIQFAQAKAANPQDQTIPWKELTALLTDAVDTWQRKAADMNLANAKKAQELFQVVDDNILKPIAVGNAGVQPNLQVVLAWVAANQPASKSLFKSDPTTTVTPPAQ